MNKELIYDWTKIPKKYNWVARDKSGDLYAYQSMPRLADGPDKGRTDDQWSGLSFGTFSQLDDAAEYTLRQVNWRDSLEQRPGTEEVEEPVQDGSLYDWSKIPEKYNWVAKDRFSGLYGYECKPVRHDDTEEWYCGKGCTKWFCERGCNMFENEEEVSLHEVDWKDSLEQRPGTEEVEMPAQDGPLYDWSKIPAKYSWVARDKGGDLYTYVNRPFIPDNVEKGIIASEWSSLRNTYRQLEDVADYTLQEVHWRDSLEQRPGTVEEEDPVQDGPLYDWSKVPEECNWVGTDEGGDTWGFEVKPIMAHRGMPGEGTVFGNNVYMSGPSGLAVKLPDVQPLRSVIWYESLEQRPVSKQGAEPQPTTDPLYNICLTVKNVHEVSNGKTYVVESNRPKYQVMDALSYFDSLIRECMANKQTLQMQIHRQVGEQEEEQIGYLYLPWKQVKNSTFTLTYRKQSPGQERIDNL